MNNSQLPLETVLQIMQDSLEKKIELLSGIEEKSKEQEAIIKKNGFTLKELDDNMDAKTEMIEKLALLDSGFESCYEQIRAELLENKDLYRPQIEEIQNLIVEVTARGASIEVLEARNKTAIENYFSKEKKELQNRKKVVAAGYDYYKAANKMKEVSSHFVDTKH